MNPADKSLRLSSLCNSSPSAGVNPAAQRAPFREPFSSLWTMANRFLSPFRIVWSCSKLFDVRFSQSLITAKKSALFVFRTDFNLHFLSLSLATFASGCKTFKAYGFRNSQKLLEEFRNFPFKLLNSFESKSDTIARSSCCTEAAHIQILCQEAPVQKLHTEAPYRQLDRYWFWNLEVQSKHSNSTFEADKDSEWRALSMKSLSSATRSGFRVSDLWGKRIC